MSAKLTNDFYEIIEFCIIGGKGRIRIVVFVGNIGYREEIAPTGDVQVTAWVISFDPLANFSTAVLPPAFIESGPNARVR